MPDDDKDGLSGDEPSSRAMVDEPSMVTMRHAQTASLPTDERNEAVLVVVRGLHEGQVFGLRVGESVIGRGRGVDVYINDRDVSRTHVRISVDPGGRLELLDLESTNGTFINGIRVTRETLRLGDRIRMGPNVLLELRAAPRPPKPPKPGAPVGREHDSPVLRGRRPPPDLTRRTEDTTPSSDPNLAPCWGYSEAAIDAYSRMLEIRRKRLGARHPAVAEILETMAIASIDNGDVERGIERLREALDILEDHTSAMPRATARVLLRLATVEAPRGRSAVAIRRLERAERLFRPFDDAQVELARARLLLAQLLSSTGLDPRRAVTLAQLARDTFAKGGPSTKAYLEEAQAWLLGSTTALAASRKC